ncbi:hypothetical protein R6Q59_022205 [Mikania micrantha]
MDCTEPWQPTPPTTRTTRSRNHHCLHQTPQKCQLAKRRSNTYVIFWLYPDVRLATKSNDSNSTKPVWNECFIIHVSSSLVVLTLEIFHPKLLDTLNPLVGTLRILIDDLPNPEDSTIIRTFDLQRPSGRPDSKIRLKLELLDRTFNLRRPSGHPDEIVTTFLSHFLLRISPRSDIHAEERLPLDTIYDTIMSISCFD